MKGIVIQAYSAAFLDPLTIVKGEALKLGRRDDEWPGWIWCTNVAGESRWAPENFLRIAGEQGIALRDYATTELTVQAGEELNLHEHESGWYWATDRQGQEGWVPASHVEVQGITIREARPADAASIASLIQELASSIDEQSPISEAYVLEYLGLPEDFVLLAEDSGQVIGLLSYSLRPNLYHAGYGCLIEELVVQASHRSRGIGGVLLEYLMEKMEAWGVEEVSVSVMPDNSEALEFYRRHGMLDEAVFLEKHLADD
ncbi:MAG: GNAT family N-acetyltransferase [Chloroflexota bacterium]